MGAKEGGENEGCGIFANLKKIEKSVMMEVIAKMN